MATGQVKWFHSKKGYGFITVDGDNKDIFVHYSAIKAESNGFKTLHQNDKVSFEIQEGRKGPEAHDVVVTEAAPLPLLVPVENSADPVDPWMMMKTN